MRIILFFSLSIFFHWKLFAQNNQAVKEGSEENLKEIASQVFKYPDFTDGNILWKDGTSNKAKLNYNRASGQLMMIDRIGKSVVISDPEKLDRIIIAQDTFYFNNNNFLLKITHFPIANLYLKETIGHLINQNNESLLNNSDGSKPFFLSEDQKTKKTLIESNPVFKLISEYFIADKFLNFYPATKKSFYDLFDTQKKELKTFLKGHPVNFTNIEGIEKLLEYMNNS